MAAFALCLHAGYVNIGVIFQHSVLLIRPHNSKAESALLDEIFTCASHRGACLVSLGILKILYVTYNKEFNISAVTASGISRAIL